MRKTLLLIWHFSLLLFSCGDFADEQKALNTKIDLANVIPLTLTPATYSTHKYDYFNANVIIEESGDTVQFCECSRLSDKITITIHNGGGMAYDELIIEFADNSFISHFKHIGDVKTLDFNAYAIAQKLKLDKLDPRPGDTLTGELKFMGLVIDAFSQIPVNRIHIKGRFTCVVKRKNTDAKIRYLSWGFCDKERFEAG